MDQETKADYADHMVNVRTALEQAWRFVSDYTESSAAYSALARVELDLAREIREASREQ